MDTQGLVIYMGSFSKTLSPASVWAGSWRHRSCCRNSTPPNRARTSRPAPSCRWWSTPIWEDYDLDANIRSLNALYHKRRDLMLSLLEQEFPKGSAWTHPQGGLFIWVTVPEQIDTAKIMPQVVARQGGLHSGALLLCRRRRDQYAAAELLQRQ